MDSLDTAPHLIDKQFLPLNDATVTSNSAFGSHNTIQSSPRKSGVSTLSHEYFPSTLSLLGPSFRNVITNFQRVRHLLPTQRKDIDCVLVTLTPSKQVFHKNVMLQTTTDLIGLITQLQKEVDIVLENPPHLLCSIKIFHAGLITMPPITGELLGASEDQESTHGVKWECRRGISGKELCEYWDCLREWLAAQENRENQRAIFRISTVPQQSTDNNEMLELGIGRGHHFVRSLDELYGVRELSQRRSTTPQEIVLRRSVRMAAASEKSHQTDRVDSTKLTMSASRRNTTADIDHNLITMIRALADERSLTFRPSTPELILTNKILRREGLVAGEGKPSYEEMMEMHEDMVEAGYRSMPAWVYKKAKQVTHTTNPYSWGTFQKLGRNEDARHASWVINLERVACDETKAPVFVDADDPSYTEPYRIGCDAEWENIVGTLRAGNVVLVPETCNVDYFALAKQEEFGRPGQQKQILSFAAGKAFDSEGDEMFCVSKVAEQPDCRSRNLSTNPMIQTMQEQEAENRKQVVYEVAKLNVERFTEPSTAPRGYQAALSQCHSSAASNQMSLHEQQIPPHPSGSPSVAMRVNSPKPFMPHNVLLDHTIHRSSSESGTTTDAITRQGTAATPFFSNHGNTSGRSTPNPDMSIGQLSRFNPSTAAYQFQAGPANLNQTVPPPHFNPYQVNTSNAITTTNWHNFAYNQAQPRSNLVNQANSGADRHTVKSPFTHRFSVRLDDSTSTQGSDDSVHLKSRRNQLLNKYPLHRDVTTSFVGEPRSPSPSRAHVNRPDGTQGAFSRLSDVPALKHDGKMLGKMQGGDILGEFEVGMRAQHRRKRSDKSFASG